MADDFITKFHNLPGITIKERQNNLFSLLNSHKPSEEDLLTITKNLKPRNHLEKIFRVDYLIFFKQFNELYLEFLKGNQIVVKKLAKQKWFYQKAFGSSEPEEFVEGILPTLGHNLKLKVLKKVDFARNNDEIFTRIHKKYGLELAIILLDKCSVEVIEKILKEEYVRFSLGQIRVILGKDTKLIDLYFEERSKHEGGLDWANNSPILVFLAQKDPSVFARLFTKHDFETTLGQRTTKSIISQEKKKILSDRKHWASILKPKALVRKLGNDMKDIFFEKKLYHYFWQDFIKHYPKKYQFEIFKTQFNDIHKDSFGTDPDDIDDNILDMIFDINERQNYAELKLNKDSNKHYLKYFSSKQVFGEFLEKLPNLPKRERSNYIEYVTNSSILCKDTETFLELCKLLITRFKNDDTSIRNSFFSCLASDEWFFGLLTQEHWKYITEILTIDQKKDFSDYYQGKILAHYIKFLLETKQEIKGTVLKFDKWVDYFCYSSDYFTKDILVTQEILKVVLEEGPPKNLTKAEVEAFDGKIAQSCRTITKNYPKYSIPYLDNPRIIASITHSLEDEPTYDDGNFQYFVCQKSTSPQVTKIQELYFKNFKTIGRIQTCFWLLKHDPSRFVEYYNEFLQHHFEGGGVHKKEFWRRIKKYSNLGLDTKMVAFCKEKLEEEVGNKHKLIRALSILADPDEYIKLIEESYLPKTKTVDLSDEIGREKYTTQSYLVKNLRYLEEPVKITPLVLKFCVGDYLQHALSALYSTIYRLPEVESRRIITEILKIKAVSTRKHAVHLTSVICDTPSVLNCFKNQDLLTPIVKYFLKNPSLVLWDLTENRILEIEEKHIECLKWILDAGTIPYQYYERFFNAIFSALQTHEHQEIKKLLFRKFEKCTGFGVDLAKRIVEDSLLVTEEANPMVGNLLLDLDTEEIFQSTKQQLLDIQYQDYTEYANSLQKFVKTTFDIYMARGSSSNFQKRFTEMMKTSFPYHLCFEEIILAELTTLKGKTPEITAKMLMEKNRELQKQYRVAVSISFAEIVKNHIFHRMDHEIIFELCYNLLEFSNDGNDHLFVVKLLPNEEPKLIKSYKFYEEICKKLRGVNDKSVQLVFNMYLKSVCCKKC